MKFETFKKTVWYDLLKLVGIMPQESRVLAALAKLFLKNIRRRWWNETCRPRHLSVFS